MCEMRRWTGKKNNEKKRNEKNEFSYENLNEV